MIDPQPEVIEDIAHALHKLDEEVESADELTDLTDNFESLASALLPTVTLRRRLKPYRLHEVIKQLAKERSKDEAQRKRARRLAQELKDLARDIRVAEYGGWLEDDDDLVFDANALRELLVEEIRAIFPAVEDVDTDDEEQPDDEADEP